MRKSEIVDVDVGWNPASSSEEGRTSQNAEVQLLFSAINGRAYGISDTVYVLKGLT
jgi:hypothetical protein